MHLNILQVNENATFALIFVKRITVYNCYRKQFRYKDNKDKDNNESYPTINITYFYKENVNTFIGR